MESQPRPGRAGPAAAEPKVEIVVRPDNNAPTRPPAGRLGPLRNAPERLPWSALPAGVAPWFGAALAAAGYSLPRDDRRRSAPLRLGGTLPTAAASSSSSGTPGGVRRENDGHQPPRGASR